MSGLRTGIPNNSLVAADDRIPFPRTDTPTRCQDDPHLFAIEDVTDHTQRKKALAKAKRACSGCPIATGCLKWALANIELTPRVGGDHRPRADQAPQGPGAAPSQTTGSAWSPNRTAAARRNNAQPTSPRQPSASR